ncbi:MAG: heparinase II/III family protein [Clostridia bacterium]|nr:heparinase II/III family protein [Clostridia bacterium]
MNYFNLINEETSKTPSAYLGDYNEARKAYKDSFCVVAGSANVMIDGNKYRAHHPTIYENMQMLVPVCMLGAAYGFDVCFDGNIAVCMQKNVTIKENDTEFIFGTEVVKLSVPVRKANDTLYVELRPFAERVLGKSVYQSDYGIAVVSDTEINPEHARKALCYLVFDRPNADTLKKTLLAKNPDLAHPRILFRNEDFDRVLELCKTDENAAKWSKDVIEEADVFVSQPLAQMAYDSAGIRLQNLPCVREILSSYWAYLVTDDEKYVNYVIDSAMATCNNYTHWGHQKHYLEVGETAGTMGLVFDLFYDRLTKQQRDLIAKKIIEFVMLPSRERYHGNHPYGGLEWPINPNNWNIVVNKGIIMAALAIGDEYETELCMDMLEKALRSVENMMPTFAPEGAWGEGVSYWVYTMFNLMRGIQSLKTALGSDYGICNTPGFLETAYFPFMTCGNTGVFAYHDVPRECLVSGDSTVFELAKLNNNPSLAALQLDTMRKNNSKGDVFALFWYDPSFVGKADELPLDCFYPSCQVATTRSDWGMNATWLGIHAGPNDFPHGHVDIGSFEFESEGVKFASDMGSDNYNLPGYWDTKVRNLYISRAEGHNVYVVNPDFGAGQVVDAIAQITPVRANSDGSIHTIDMTPAYETWAESAKRGFMLSCGRKVLTVQDEIVPKGNDEYLWFWQTAADIEFAEDGKKAILTRQNKKLTLYFDASVDFQMEKCLTVPLSTSPQIEGQLGNFEKAINKITVRFKSEKGVPLTFRAVAIPEGCEFEAKEIIPVANW